MGMHDQIEEKNKSVVLRLIIWSISHLNNWKMFSKGGRVLSKSGSALGSCWKFVFQRLAQSIGTFPPVSDITLDAGTVEFCSMKKAFKEFFYPGVLFAGSIQMFILNLAGQKTTYSYRLTKHGRKHFYKLGRETHRGKSHEATLSG